MTDTTDLLNAGEIVESCGQAWTLAHVGPALRAKFSAWLKGRARKELTEQRQQDILDEQGYRESLSMLTEAMAAGAYNWGNPLDPNAMGSAIRTALQQGEGSLRLLQLMLEPRHQSVPAEQLAKIVEGNPDGVALATKACLLAIVPIPNGQAPAK